MPANSASATVYGATAEAGLGHLARGLIEFLYKEFVFSQTRGRAHTETLEDVGGIRANVTQRMPASTGPRMATGTDRLRAARIRALVAQIRAERNQALIPPVWARDP